MECDHLDGELSQPLRLIGDLSSTRLGSRELAFCCGEPGPSQPEERVENAQARRPSLLCLFNRCVGDGKFACHGCGVGQQAERQEEEVVADRAVK